MNANVEIDGGTNGGVAGRYDTITVLDSAVLDSGDLANVKGVEALVLAGLVNGNSTYRIDLTEAFLLNNTAATNITTTTIDDTTFRIGSANSVSGTALNAGDTVTIDISDLLNANAPPSRPARLAVVLMLLWALLLSTTWLTVLLLRPLRSLWLPRLMLHVPMQVSLPLLVL